MASVLDFGSTPIFTISKPLTIKTNQFGCKIYIIFVLEMTVNTTTAFSSDQHKFEMTAKQVLRRFHVFYFFFVLTVTLIHPESRHKEINPLVHYELSGTNATN